jgi:hypothetical protein
MDLLKLEWLHYEKRYWYPHMAAADITIWNQYLEKNPEAFDLVSYDVAIGEGAQFDLSEFAGNVAGLNRLYQRRIDVLARRGGITTVVELKPRASTSAIGQVVGYHSILQRDNPELQLSRPLIITDQLLPEMQFLADAAGVDIHVV